MKTGREGSVKEIELRLQRISLAKDKLKNTRNSYLERINKCGISRRSIGNYGEVSQLEY